MPILYGLLILNKVKKPMKLFLGLLLVLATNCTKKTTSLKKVPEAQTTVKTEEEIVKEIIVKAQEYKDLTKDQETFVDYGMFLLAGSVNRK